MFYPDVRSNKKISVVFVLFLSKEIAIMHNIFRKAKRFYFILVLILAVLITPTLVAAEKWEMGPSIPEGAEEVVGAAVGNSMLVYGGLGPEYVPRGLFWMFDTSKEEWIELPSNPIPVHHPAIVTIENKVYLFGGFVKPKGEASWKPVDDASMFDMETRTWTTLKPLPTARGALTAAAVGAKIYVIGGVAMPKQYESAGLTFNSPSEQLTVNEVYDTESNTWSQAASIPTPRNHMGAATVDGKIYVIGGRIGSGFILMSTNIGVNEVFDPEKNEWEPRAMLPTPRSGIGVVVLNGIIHVLGGEEWQHNRAGVFRQHEAYDPKRNRWYLLPSMRFPRHGHAVGVVNNKIYAISGANVAGGGGDHKELTYMEIYTP
jgi:N-acetylneuraminic acid mutarotase